MIKKLLLMLALLTSCNSVLSYSVTIPGELSLEYLSELNDKINHYGNVYHFLWHEPTIIDDLHAQDFLVNKRLPSLIKALQKAIRRANVKKVFGVLGSYIIPAVGAAAILDFIPTPDCLRYSSVAAFALIAQAVLAKVYVLDPANRTLVKDKETLGNVTKIKQLLEDNIAFETACPHHQCHHNTQENAA